MSRRRFRRVDATGRSIGPERHIRLQHWMLRSEVWRSLSLGGRCALVELYNLYNGSNNGELFLSARELGRRLNVRKDTAAGYLWDCEAAGFIRARQRGAFAWKARHATCWVLTEFPFAGALPTKDYMSWKPGDVLTTRPRPGVSKSRSRARKAGQPVTESGTATDPPDRIWHAERGRLSQIGARDGPGKRDTDSIPRGVVPEREAAAPRKRASGGERATDDAPVALGRIIERAFPSTSETGNEGTR